MQEMTLLREFVYFQRKIWYVFSETRDKTDHFFTEKGYDMKGKNRMFRRLLASLLVICALAAMASPIQQTASAEAYVFPDYGPATALGTALINTMTITEYATLLEHNEKEYLLVPSKGGALYVFSFSDYLDRTDETAASWIYDSVKTGIGNPRGIAVDSQNIAYVTGDSRNVVAYDISKKAEGTEETETVQITLPKSTGISAITVDDADNIYVSASNTDKTYKITRDTAQESGYSYTELFDSDGALLSVSGVVWGDGYLYAQGLQADAEGCIIYKLDPSTGEVMGQVAYEKTGGIYYLSYVNGVLFGGSSATVADGMIVVDTATMTKTAITMEGLTEEEYQSAWIMGVVTEPRNGYSYMVAYGEGLWKYDITERTAVRIRTNTALNLRIRDPYVTYGEDDSEFLLTLASTGSRPYMLQVAGSTSAPLLTDLINGAVSTWSSRTVAPGVEGTEVAVYVGGYMTGKVASYTPGAQEPINSTAFKNGHDQTDAMIVYNDKIYGGAYNGAYLFEYDPATGEVKDLISDLKANYSQVRIHALAAGDNKIFFSTVPATGELGGCIGWYDLSTGEYYCQRNVVQDQILICLAYGEDTNILYGATSIHGGSKSLPTKSEAYIMAYDVDAKALLGSFSVRYSQNSNSDIVDSILAPEYISGISIDPDGKMWGLFYNTVFSFEYNKAANTMRIHEEWSSGTTSSDPYTSSHAMSHFPRPFLYDGNGYMYIYLRSDGLHRFNRTSQTVSGEAMGIDTSRIYTMGADGNIYYMYGTELCRIGLTRTAITEDLITAAGQTDAASVTEAMAAYNALSAQEQAQLSSATQDKLNTLNGYDCVIISGETSQYSNVQTAMAAATSSHTIRLIADYTGNITVLNGATLDLDSKIVTGTVDGTNGYVIDSGSGTGGVTGSVNLKPDNPQIPLLDEETYRFFDYSVSAKAAVQDGETKGQVNFWFDMEFTDMDAYALLARGEGTNLDIRARLYLDGELIPEDVVFSAVIEQWAGKDHSGSDDWALYVAVTGIPASVRTVTVEPVFTASGVSGSFGTVSYTVPDPEAVAGHGYIPAELL